MREFELYFDDVELTRRMVSLGIDLRLCPGAVVEDVDPKWVSSSGTYISGMIASGDRRRTYYSYRNSAYLDLRAARSFPTRARLASNLLIYSVYVVMSARRDWRFIVDYFQAVTDGLLGRLGERTFQAPRKRT